MHALKCYRTLILKAYDDWKAEVYCLFGLDETVGDNGKSHAVMRLAG